MEEELLNSEIAFSQPVINIGADAGNDIVLHGSAIADFHAMLHYDANRWALIPLDPAYPILVNGHGISPDGCELTSGMEITISNYKLTVLLNGINADFQIREESRMSSFGVPSSSDSGESDILLSLTGPSSYEMEAGSYVEYEATVTNAGSLVANMQLQLQGIPSAWVQIIPPVLNLNEGKRGTFSIRINPPRDSSASAGVYNLHFVAISPNYPRETGTANAALTILPYSEYLVTGMTPRRLNLSRRKSSDFSDLVVTNNSNAASTFIVRASDDANELQFAYKHPDNTMVQGQDSVTVRSGDRARVPIQVSINKKPLIGVVSSHHHYYVNVHPADRPGEAQSVMGDVTVPPLINLFWLLFTLLIIACVIVYVFQPRIFQLDGVTGKRFDVILTGDSFWLRWKVSRFASKVMLDDGTGPKDVQREGSMLITPDKSTTYKLRSENFFSTLANKIFGTNNYEMQLSVNLIPRRPSIDLLTTDPRVVKDGQPLKLSWAVSNDVNNAAITENKQSTQLNQDNLSGNETKNYTRDTLISLKAENGSSYDMKSLFVNVQENHIDLVRFTAWVRPNGIAIPDNNDVRRATRWSMIQASVPSAVQTIKPAAVNPLPAAQNNVLEIPDDFTSSGAASQKMNPELQNLSGQTGGLNNSYQVVNSQDGWEGLLVKPVQTATAVPTVPVLTVPVLTPVASASVPATAPENSVSGREFSVKLAEVVEDPFAESGYRKIEYFPNYVLQKGEQVLVEWAVEGVPKVKIENLSSQELPSTGADYIYPEKSMDLLLNAQIADLQKAYSLPIRVAGEADNGQGSGLNCELKANSTTLAVPGSIMLTWTGGGNNRVQLLSSIKAEEESKAAEEKKEAQAKAEGKEYTRQQNQAMSGGIIGDYLEPAGFMRVDINKQTTFVLNAYDGNNNVICSKSVEVKYTGGNDKLDLTFKIKEVTDQNNVSQREYAVNQPVQVTVELSNYAKGQDPTGSFMVTDGYSTCSMTYPLTTCTLTTKHPGTMKLTAVYSGDDAYNKKTATGSMKVINKIETETQILEAYKSGEDLANALTDLVWDESLAYGHKPTGAITYTAGSSTCVLDMESKRLDCGGFAEYAKDELYKITQMQIADKTAKTIRAKYSGDSYFYPSVSEPYTFITIGTDLKLSNPLKKTGGLVDAELELSWVDTPPDDKTPTGTVKLISGSASCSLYISSDNPDLTDCPGSVAKDENGKIIIKNMNMGSKSGDTLKAEYPGDGLFLASFSDELSFMKFNPELGIKFAYKPCDPKYANLVSELTWNKTEAVGLTPAGTIQFTVGSGTCKLDLATKKLLEPCGSDLVRVTEREEKVNEGAPDEYKKGILEVLILKMLLDDSTADRIKAEYSGDASFNSASTVTSLFQKLDTAIAVEDLRKDSLTADRADLTSDLTWDPEDKVMKDLESYFGSAIANDLKPTGTIKFTPYVGTTPGQVITWDIVKQELDVNTPTAPAVDKGSGFYKTIITKMLLQNPNTDRIRAEYSGDAFFNGSVSTIEKFNYKIGTSLKLSELKKYNGQVSADATLTWEEEPADGSAPVGTIVLTSGSATCTLDITANPPSFSGCMGSVNVVDDDPDDKTVRYELTDIAFTGGAGTDIKADYSGDDKYLPAASATLSFDKFETETEILLAYKPNDSIYVNVASAVKWNKSEASSVEPTGTVKFTMGTTTCTLTLSTQRLDCGTDSTEVRITDKVIDPGTPDEYIEGSLEMRFIRLLLNDKNADRIKAEYSGDANFNASSSVNVLFRTLDTTTTIPDSWKDDETSDNVNLDTMVKWDMDSDTMKDMETWFGSDVANNLKPTGTITFTLMTNTGATDKTCVWNIKSRNLVCSTPEDPVVRTDTAGVYELIIAKMLLQNKGVDRVQAEYSGDAFFNPSVSTISKIKTKIKTELTLSDVKNKNGSVKATANLSWESKPDSGDAPGGTIRFTSGSAVCVLDISANPAALTEGCTGTVTVVDDDPDDTEVSYAITDLVFSDTLGAEIKAEYSGNDVFMGSSSPVMSFDKNETELNVVFAYKPHDPKFVSIYSELKWNKTEAASDLPSGSVVFAPGSGSCTLNLSNSNLNCDAEAVEVEYKEEIQNEGTEDEYLQGICEITIVKMLLDDGNADRVKADYAGDAHFNKSSSKKTLFSTLDTTIALDNLAKPAEDRVNMSASLEYDWDSEAMTNVRKYFADYIPMLHNNRYTPGGTITFSTIGAGDAPTSSCVWDIAKKEMSCSSLSSPSQSWGPGLYGVEAFRMLIGDKNADRARVQFSGDGFFNKSVSTIVKFPDAIKTELNLTNYDKSTNDLVDANVTLTWADTPPQYTEVTGTIKLTSGSSSCTLDLSSNPIKFNNCTGQVAVEGGSYNDHYATYKIRNLSFPGGSGEDLKAEYSGNYSYKPSTSNTVFFTKVDTNLVITLAYKPNDPKFANVTSKLSWEVEPAALRKPIGTIKFTVGSDTCTLNLETDKLNCESVNVSKVDHQDGSYEMVIEKMLLADSSADRIKAEYSGDPVFNPSSSVTVLFKTIDTTISVRRATKADENHANVRAVLEWNETLAEGRKPAGTIKFVIGSGSCTLKIDTQRMSCEPATGTVSADHTVFEGWNMLLDDPSADRVYAEYSGDGFFNPSVSTKVLFSSANTSIVITKAYKSSDGYVNLDADIDWDEQATESEILTGVLKITVGDKNVTYNITSGELGADQGTAEADDTRHHFKFRDLFFEGTGDVSDVKIEYLGNGFFGPSHNTATFTKIGTTTIITYAYPGSIPGESSISPYMNVKVIPEVEGPNNANLTGTIRVTVGYEAETLQCELPMHKAEATTCRWAKFTMTTTENGKNNLININYPGNYPGLLTYAVVEYLGDNLYAGSESQKYEMSKNNTTLTISGVSQISNGRKNLAFNLTAGNAGTTGGTVTIMTDNGKSCHISRRNGSGQLVENTCQTVNFELTNNKTWLLQGMQFDPDPASQITVIYDGSGTNNNGSYDSAEFSRSDTTTSIAMISRSGADMVDMRLNISYIREDFGGDNYPTGDLVIKNGSYTCTIPLPNKDGGEGIGNLGVVTKDCGGGSITLTGWLGAGKNAMQTVQIWSLPIPEPESTFTAEYKGDIAYNPSSASGEFSDKLETKLEAHYVPADGTNPAGVQMTLSPAGSQSSGVPSGTLIFTLPNSGDKCYIWVYANSVSHGATCTGTPSFISRNGDSVTFFYAPASISPEDEVATMQYEGNDYYRGVTGEVRMSRYKLTLKPEKVYTDGRLYLNIVSGDKRYPFYPAKYADPYWYCNGGGGSDSECHDLFHDVSFNIKVETESSAPALPSDTVITLSGGGIETNCTPRSIGNGVYSCTSGLVSLPMTGIFTINVSYPGSEVFENAEAVIEDVYGIRVRESGRETMTMITTGGDSNFIRANVGDTVTVEAKSYEKERPLYPVNDPSYIFFTYDWNRNERIQSCYGKSCDLKITENTTHIYAEFVGDYNFTPSIAYKKITRPMTVGVQSASPVSIFVNLEP